MRKLRTFTSTTNYEDIRYMSNTIKLFTLNKRKTSICEIHLQNKQMCHVRIDARARNKEVLKEICSQFICSSNIVRDHL